MTIACSKEVISPKWNIFTKWNAQGEIFRGWYGEDSFMGDGNLPVTTAVC